MDGTPSNLVGQTRSYDVDTALSGGVLSSSAKADTVMGDPLKVDWATASTSSMNINPSRPTDAQVQIDLTGDAGNPLVPLSDIGAISWDLTLTVDSTDPFNPQYEITGDYDGFPAYELHIDVQRIFDHDPIATGEGLFSLFPPMEHSVNDSGAVNH